MHVFEGRGQLLSPEGDVLWSDPDWVPNALHDAGEQSMLNVFLKELANPSKYLGLLNDGSVAETDGTMGAVTEAGTPGSGGYARQQIAAGDWTDDGLISGDYRFSAAEKTFGPITDVDLPATHVAVTTAETGDGLLLASLALPPATVVLVGRRLRYTLRWQSA